MAWNQITFTMPASKAEAFGDLLFDMGSVSVSFMDTEDNPIYEPELNKTELWASTKVVSLWDPEITAQDVLQALQDIENQELVFLVQDYDELFIDDQDWTRKWMDNFKPMKFGEKLWICPTEYEVDVEDSVVIKLDPGLAFGTGTHPTTRLCLEYLDSLALAGKLQDKVVVDYGCGSGILALAALKLGAKKVYAVDIDSQAIEATLSNAKMNGVAQNLEVYLVEDFKKLEVHAQVLVSNILAGPLVELAPDLASMQKSSDDFALSGILQEKFPNIEKAYIPFYDIQQVLTLEDWVLVRGQRK